MAGFFIGERPMQTDRQFCVSGNWALASDGMQWVLQRRNGPGWKAVSFVRSTKDILARCMREKGCSPPDQARLLDGLPSSFDEWHQGERLSDMPHAAQTEREPEIPLLG